ncbi:DUF4331 domain-containing protein [Streptomyces sp. A7024]|uniref:DUF4331 domain-containing protein n=1 Tax=Streptomyces coryli TaxID=1128680 RepID=A0A6G4UBH0_9ACTN|nr:DUF4331 domain-containing protein [Streptomyces coryli]NGN68728.1 DUF4331 domain-containing protein [Streptomyces coryli]
MIAIKPIRSVAALTCGALAAGALAAGSVSVLQPRDAAASSHREAPLISGLPQYDNTDVYAFVSPDKPDSTTLIANWQPFSEPAGGPNFYPFAEDAQYDIHIDNDGDGQGDLLYRWTFDSKFKNGNTYRYNTGPVTSLDDPDLNFRETYDIDLLKLDKQKIVSKTKIANNIPTAPSNVGRASMPNYKTLRDQSVKQLPGGHTAFAGQADDPFFLDLRVFDEIYGGDLSEVGNDTVKGYNVNSVALQVPTKQVRQSDKQPVIGVWSTTQKKNAQGNFVQVSRLGAPLVDEVVIPVKDKDKFNASSPWDDAQFAKYVNDPELPKLIEKAYKIPAPATPRKDLVSVFLTGVDGLNKPPNVRPAEELRLNTSTPPTDSPKRLGVLDGDNAGFPNGRRLTDDVVDIELQALEGELTGNKNDLGDAVDVNDRDFGKAFPYLALPESGSRGPLAGKARGSVTENSGTLLNGGSGTSSGSDAGSDNAVLIASGAAGGAGALLVGTGLMWWRIHRRRSLGL